jgi:hypothetical protein
VKSRRFREREKEEIIWRRTISSEGIGKKSEDGDFVLPNPFPVTTLPGGHAR